MPLREVTHWNVISPQGCHSGILRANNISSLRQQAVPPLYLATGHSAVPCWGTCSPAEAVITH